MMIYACNRVQSATRDFVLPGRARCKSDSIRDLIKTPITIPRYAQVCRFGQLRDQTGIVVKVIGLAAWPDRSSHETRPSRIARVGPSRPAT